MYSTKHRLAYRLWVMVLSFFELDSFEQFKGSQIRFVATSISEPETLPLHTDTLLNPN
jgi:hypothetical protein